MFTLKKINIQYMKQYRTLAAIGFILFLSWTLFICHAVSQVKFTQVERSSIKWTIPVAKRVVPGIPDFVMTHMTLANLIDSTEIELGTKIDSMKWATGDTLKLYTSDGVFKTKITFAGMGTVTDVTGTSPIIITGTSTVTPNVTIQNATTSQSGALTSTDWTTFNGKIGGDGVITRIPIFSGSKTLTYDNNLSFQGGSLLIGTTAPVSGLPTTKLQIVQDPAVADWTFYMKTSTVLGGSYGARIDGGSHASDYNFWINNSYPFIVRGNGRVGIGTSSPTQMLDVVGTARIRGAIYDSANSAGSSGQVLTSQGSGAWTWSTPTGTVGGSGALNTIPYWNSTTGLGSTPFTYASNIMTLPTGNSIYFAGTSTIIDKNNSGGSASQIFARAASGGGVDWQSPSELSLENALTFTSPLSRSVNTISIPSASAFASGYLSSTDWNTFNNKEPAITPGTTSQYWRGDKTWQTLNTGVTTLAAIGATPNANGATISGSTLNLQPASASFGGVMTTGTQTIAGAKTFSYLGGAPSGGNSLVVADPNGRLENLYGATVGHVPKWNGTAFTLQADATGASGITSLGGLTGATQTLAYATSGTTPSWLSTGTSHTFRLPAGATGEVLKWSSGDWRPGFPISLTTTGSSGVATYNSTTGVLNIPNYAGAAGEQFWTTTTTSTSHEIILKDHAGTTNVSALKLIEGAGIELTTSAGTFSNSNLTINTVGTAVGQMHKEGVTTISFTAVTPQKVALTTSFTSGSGISTSDANDRITVASSGKYMITYSMDVDMNATTFGLTAYVKVSGSTDLSASYKQYNNDTNLTPLSKTFYVDLTAGQYIELWLSNSHTVSTNSLWDPILTIQRVQ